MKVMRMVREVVMRRKDGLEIPIGPNNTGPSH